MGLQWRIEASQLTDIGRKRQENQDYVGCFEAQEPHPLSAYGRLYLVADGVGGGAAGDKASRHAVQRILY
jgi:serine/threonine protein phosphatase PrpC